MKNTDKEDFIMKKKKAKQMKSWDIAATTTSWDWGFKPVPNKGGRTQNHEIQESMIQREIREMNDKWVKEGA